MATRKEQKILENSILKPVSQDRLRFPKDGITAFLSMKGNRYKGELMVVGRAPNGWGDWAGVTKEDLSNPRELSQLASRAYKESKGTANCPMQWVSKQWNTKVDGEYDPNRSAFWRVMRKVVGELELADINSESWPSTLVWSNLYKVAPAAGGNPSNRLCDSQLPGCIELLKQEISQNRPQRILFLSGWNWAEPFIDEIFGVSKKNQKGFVEFSAATSATRDKPIRLVVAVHPQGKKEEIWVRNVLRNLDS